MILTPLFATTHRAQSPLYYPGSHPQRSNLLPPQLSSQSSRSESEDLTYLDLANASDGDFVAEPIPGAVESDIQEDEWFAGDDEWQDQNWEGARSISTYGLCVGEISCSQSDQETHLTYMRFLHQLPQSRTFRNPDFKTRFIMTISFLSYFLLPHETPRILRSCYLLRYLTTMTRKVQCRKDLFSLLNQVDQTRPTKNQLRAVSSTLAEILVKTQMTSFY